MISSILTTLGIFMLVIAFGLFVVYVVMMWKGEWRND